MIAVCKLYVLRTSYVYFWGFRAHTIHALIIMCMHFGITFICKTMSMATSIWRSVLLWLKCRCRRHRWQQWGQTRYVPMCEIATHYVLCTIRVCNLPFNENSKIITSFVFVVLSIFSVCAHANHKCRTTYECNEICILLNVVFSSIVVALVECIRFERQRNGC